MSPIFSSNQRIFPPPKKTEWPNGFEMNNYDNAWKEITIEVNGKQYQHIFKVNFESWGSEKSRRKFLKQFTPEKVERIMQESRALGLGEKFAYLHISQDYKGHINKAKIWKFDRNSEVIEDLSHLKTLDKIVSNNFTPFINDWKNKKKEDKIKEEKKQEETRDKLATLESQTREIEQRLKGLYVGERPVIDIINQYLEKHKEKPPTPEEYKKFINENIFSHPEFRRKSS